MSRGRPQPRIDVLTIMTLGGKREKWKEGGEGGEIQMKARSGEGREE